MHLTKKLIAVGTLIFHLSYIGTLEFSVQHNIYELFIGMRKLLFSF